MNALRLMNVLALLLILLPWRAEGQRAAGFGFAPRGTPGQAFGHLGGRTPANRWRSPGGGA
ncbi:hypothetical protein M8371_28530, partial [Klebsiella pneumoniae]|nr:hypothetical protein [Klebsiella pneumoniae]